jgi:hypothetical protein
MNVIDAAHAVVHDYPGGTPALAPRLNMAPAVLRGKVNVNDHGHHLTVVEALRIQQLTGDHRIFLAEAEELGYVALPAPHIEDEDVGRALTRLCGEFGDYMRRVDESMQDGKITANERRTLERELLDMITAANHLQAILAAVGTRHG